MSRLPSFSHIADPKRQKQCRFLFYTSLSLLFINTFLINPCIIVFIYVGIDTGVWISFTLSLIGLILSVTLQNLVRKYVDTALEPLKGAAYIFISFVVVFLCCGVAVEQHVSWNSWLDTCRDGELANEEKKSWDDPFKCLLYERSLFYRFSAIMIPMIVFFQGLFFSLHIRLLVLQVFIIAENGERQNSVVESRVFQNGYVDIEMYAVSQVDKAEALPRYEPPPPGYKENDILVPTVERK